MKTITRRKFIGTTAMGLGAVWALSQFPKQLFAQSRYTFNDIPIGFQTFLTIINNCIDGLTSYL